MSPGVFAVVYPVSYAQGAPGLPAALPIRLLVLFKRAHVFHKREMENSFLHSLDESLLSSFYMSDSRTEASRPDLTRLMNDVFVPFVGVRLQHILLLTQLFFLPRASSSQ